MENHLQTGRRLTGGIKTSWVIFTGAPSSGKTSVVSELHRRGYKTHFEIARALIEERMQTGMTLLQARGDVMEFQKEILRRKLDFMQGLPPDDLVFLDRGCGDSITYFRLAGLDLAPAIAAAELYVPRAVFLFARLPLETDAVRIEDEDTAARMAHDHAADYAALGHSVIHVPIMPVDDRIRFILDHLGEP
jgi:predicted ATPase